jgi:3-deoxy-D-manno-octulosonic-acid transferase
MLRDAGVNFARRSDVLDADLLLKSGTTDIAVLMGDSMGEMYF